MCLIQVFSQMFIIDPFIVWSGTAHQEETGPEGSHGISTRTRMQILSVCCTPLPATVPQELTLLVLALIPKIYLLTEGTQQGLTAHSLSASLKSVCPLRAVKLTAIFRRWNFQPPASPLTQVFLIVLASATRYWPLFFCQHHPWVQAIPQVTDGLLRFPLTVVTIPPPVICSEVRIAPS